MEQTPEAQEEQDEATMTLLRVVADGLIQNLAHAYSPYEVMVIGSLIQAMGAAHMDISNAKGYQALLEANKATLGVFSNLREELLRRMA